MDPPVRPPSGCPHSPWSPSRSRQLFFRQGTTGRPLRSEGSETLRVAYRTPPSIRFRIRQPPSAPPRLSGSCKSNRGVRTPSLGRPLHFRYAPLSDAPLPGCLKRILNGARRFPEVHSLIAAGEKRPGPRGAPLTASGSLRRVTEWPGNAYSTTQAGRLHERPSSCPLVGQAVKPEGPKDLSAFTAAAFSRACKTVPNIKLEIRQRPRHHGAHTTCSLPASFEGVHR